MLQLYQSLMLQLRHEVVTSCFTTWSFECSLLTLLTVQCWHSWHCWLLTVDSVDNSMLTLLTLQPFSSIETFLKLRLWYYMMTIFFWQYAVHHIMVFQCCHWLSVLLPGVKKPLTVDTVDTVEPVASIASFPKLRLRALRSRGQVKQVRQLACWHDARVSVGESLICRYRYRYKYDTGTNVNTKSNFGESPGICTL